MIKPLHHHPFYLLEQTIHDLQKMSREVSSAGISGISPLMRSLLDAIDHAKELQSNYPLKK
jgi:hypothetical protein